MPRAKQPEGSTADLPPIDVIEAAEADQGADIDAMFGIGDDDSAEETSAVEGGASPAPTPADAGDGEVEGSAPSPDKSPDAGAASVPPAGTDSGKPSAPSAQQEGETPPSPAPAAQPSAPPPVSEEQLRINSLEAMVQGLQAELAKSRANPPADGQQQPQAPVGGGSGGTDDLPRYQLNLPQQVAAALMSDDEQQFVGGVTHMMNSLATIVHHNVRLEMKQAISGLMRQASEQDATASQNAQIEAAREDYYKAFPAHKDPLILPLIQAETMAMSAQFPGLAWNDDFRNALGQRVESRLAQLRGQAAGGVAPPAAPAASIPAGPRPAPQGSELVGGDLIADTFS